MAIEETRFRVYLGPMPDTLGTAHTYYFQTEDVAREFAEHSKLVAWADHQVDRKVAITWPGGFTVAVTLDDEA